MEAVFSILLLWVQFPLCFMLYNKLLAKKKNITIYFIQNNKMSKKTSGYEKEFELMNDILNVDTFVSSELKLNIEIILYMKLNNNLFIKPKGKSKVDMLQYPNCYIQLKTSEKDNE